MIKRMFALSIAALFFIGMIGCGSDEVDPDESREAQNLVNGLNMALMMTNVDAYSGISLSGPVDAPPFWEGPFQYSHIPAEWNNDTYYKWLLIRFGVDSLGTAIDSADLYLMFTPDIWDSTVTDSIPTSLDIGILAETRDVWFHTVVSIPDTSHVTGSLRWNWDDTYYSYAFDNSQIDYSGQIDILTSTNIGLAAHFLFESDGSGDETYNYAEWHGTQFVRYTFFPADTSAQYDGYYTLLSEAWKVEHYFNLIREPPAY
jgi:hypothetical protein